MSADQWDLDTVVPLIGAVAVKMDTPLITAPPARKAWWRNPLSNNWFFGFVCASLWLAAIIAAALGSA